MRVSSGASARVPAGEGPPAGRAGRAARNTEEEVREATRLALSVTAESLRIWIPMALSRVSWPTASVLLHFGHGDRYPILDVRALEALGVTEPALYTLPFWSGYVAACRKIDDETGHGMRILDRALGQWPQRNAPGAAGPGQTPGRATSRRARVSNRGSSACQALAWRAVRRVLGR